MRSKYKKAKWLDTRLSRSAKKRTALKAAVKTLQIQTVLATANAQAKAIIYSSGRREGKTVALLTLVAATKAAVEKIGAPQCPQR